ncbi:hypothetical protein [Streptomyces corynorhini]|uniref:Uncharacterized protein n=1 Tax=Streptomyces corynorhini TaxID=2282652 RepID=A0A370B802_9ACTN|nr:hypothetical protein [Streptomyces corynorhini]RDG37938.1 hypothetical protein DVH02_11485 [Streptomyces corynorhini]
MTPRTRLRRASARTGEALRAARAEGGAPLREQAATFHALATGTRTLLTWPWRWAMQGEGMDKVWRGLGALWFLAAGGWIVLHALWLLPVLLLIWAVAALRAALPKESDSEDEAPSAGGSTASPECTADDVQEAPAGQRPAPAGDEFVLDLAQLIGTRNGVLLRTVAEHWHQADVDPAYGIPDVRAQCAALGIPIRPTLKTPWGVSPGVHRDDFRAALQALASTPPEPSPEAELSPSLETGSRTG